jgi:hypothetical protein
LSWPGSSRPSTLCLQALCDAIDRAYISRMSTTTERAAAALDLLPEEMREPAVAFLIEQAEKFRNLKMLIDEGLADIEAGNVKEWDFEEFLREAHLSK